MADIDKFIYYDNGSKKVLKSTDRIVIGSEGLAFEGSTNDDFETLLAVEDPTADRTITFPNTDGNVILSDSNGHVSLNDNSKLKLGTSGDLEIFHDGSNSIIKDTAASGGSTIKYLAGTQTFQNKDVNKTIAVFNAAGSVDLHHNGTKKFETTSSGIQTSGTISVNGVYTLPTSDGTSSQVLTTNGSGTVSFQDVSGGGGISNIVEDTTPQLGGNLDPNGFGISNHLLPSTANTYSLGSTALEWSDLYLGDAARVYFGNDQDVILTHIADSGLTLQMGTSQLSYDPLFTIQSSASNTNSIGPQFKIQKMNTDAGDIVGDIYFQGYSAPAYDDYARIRARAPAQTHGNLQLLTLSGNVESIGIDIVGDSSSQTPKVKISDAYYLPTSDGTSNQILQTDGSGNLSFADSSGGISNIVEDTTPQLGGNLDPNGFGISNNLLPSGANTYSLGSSALEWSDLYLGDFSVIYFGSDQDTKLTHVHNSGLKFELDSAGSNEPKFEFISNNAGNIGPSLSMFHDSSSPAVDDIFSTIEFKTNNDADQSHLVCKIQAVASSVTDGSESAEFRFLNPNSGANYSSGNVIFTADGIVKSRGGFGTLVDNVSLKLGIDEEITLTHVHNTGVNFKNESTSSGTNFNLTLQSNSTSVSSGNIISSLNFQAPNEASGSDAVLVCAGIEAVAESSFTSTSNATKLSFKTSSSESASEKMSLSSGGKLSVHGATALKIQASDPSIETDFAHIYAKDVASSAELFVKDEAGNVTQISPHNEEGDWIYWSENVKTGKKVKVNMEKMIKRLEVITGETFFEEYIKES